MKRLFVVFLLAGLTFTSSAAIAGLSRGDTMKLGRYLTDALNPFADEAKRTDGWSKFTEFFDGRNAKDLAEVADLSELLANSADRPNQRSGQYRMDCALADLGMKSDEKWPVFVNVPRKYSSSGSSPAWPLIVVVPDKGQDIEKVLDQYWKNEEIRDNYLIAVISMDYSDLEERSQKSEKDEDGKIKLSTETKKVPFHWDSKQALRRFWLHLLNLQVRQFKVDPNRVILDGIGLGREGVTSVAMGSAWRFAGLIDRGIAVDSPAAKNLSHLPVLYYPGEADMAEPKEGEKKPQEQMKEMVGDSMTVAGTDAAWSGAGEDGAGKSLVEWLGKARRARYPLPSKWVAAKDSQNFGYWGFITRRFEMGTPAEMQIAAERKTNTINVTTQNVAEFTLFLNDLLVDLDKPVKLVVNGEAKGEMERKRSADELLRRGFTHPDGLLPNDPGCVFTAHIADVQVAPPPAPKDESADKGGDGEKKE